VDFTILEASRKNMSAGYRLTDPGEDGIKRVSNRLIARLEDFQKTCANENITLLNETGYTVDEYIGDYRRMLERAVLPNLAAGKKVQLTYPPKKYAGEDPRTLTDGSFGGSSFYANWLGFDGNDMEAIIDLENPAEIKEISTCFLQLVNHIVFFPLSVEYSCSPDGKNFTPLKRIDNKEPLTRTNHRNDIQFYAWKGKPVNARYIKVTARNMKVAPVWHFGAGLSSWIFADEIEVR
jgi:hypothetical protein